jgi:hypothetical protein
MVEPIAATKDSCGNMSEGEAFRRDIVSKQILLCKKLYSKKYFTVLKI